MGFWGLYLAALIIIVSIYSLVEYATNLIKSNPKLIFPILIGMFIGYLIFF
jgi:hypothetical protein